MEREAAVGTGGMPPGCFAQFPQRWGSLSAKLGSDMLGMAMLDAATSLSTATAPHWDVGAGRSQAVGVNSDIVADGFVSSGSGREGPAASGAAEPLGSLNLSRSLDDIFASPNVLVGMTPAQVEALAREAGWTVTTLSRGQSVGGGLKIIGTQDGQMISFSPGSRHHNSTPSWKVSSGMTGTVRVPLDPSNFKP